MCCDLAGFFSQTPRRVGLDFLAAAGVTALRASSVLRESMSFLRGMIWLQVKKKLAWNCSKPASQLTLTSTLRFSGGSNNAYDACEFDGRCSNTAAQCSKTSGKMDNRRSSCNSCAGNTHIHIPGIRSRNDIRDYRIRPRRLLSRLKPERQLVLLEPEPVRLLPMEVKEVFSLGPPMCEFQFVALRVCKNRAFSF